MTRKHYYIIGGVAAVLLAGGYFAYDAMKFNKNENKQTNNEIVNVTEENKKPAQASEVKTFSIDEVNKKDGDVFAIPDTLTYKVSPSGSTSRVKMTTADGTVLFAGDSKEANPSFQIYPAGRYREGTKLNIAIEVLDGVEIKATKTIQVVL